VAGALCALLLPSVSGSTGAAKPGGIFRVSFQSLSLQSFDHIDPALAYSRESWMLLDTVCARLMRYRDEPPPALWAWWRSRGSRAWGPRLVARRRDRSLSDARPRW